MKSLIIILALLTSFAHAAETILSSHKLSGDCRALIVKKKNLNGIPSIALTEDPSTGFNALAPVGGHTVTKKCVISMNLLVPAGHKVGVYDPNTNHLHLGRFNGTQYLHDNHSSFSWEMGWDLQDAAGIPFQTRSSFNQGPLFANYFGEDFQAVLPHQWSACKRKPHRVNLKVAIQLTATSSKKNTAELIFRNGNLKLTTKRCRVIAFPRSPVPRNPFSKLKDLVMGLEGDFAKFYEKKGNKAAGTRVRKGMQELKNLSQDIYVEVQKIMNRR